MIVVADTSPINYLIQIGSAELLPKIYERVVVPRGVIQELSHIDAPAPVLNWLDRLPAWLEVRATALEPAEDLWRLGLGEREAIQLAEEEHADLLLIDERKGRLEAARRGLRTTGTLGVLLSGAELDLVDAALAYRKLVVETTFRTSVWLEEQFFAQIGRR